MYRDIKAKFKQRLSDLEYDNIFSCFLTVLFKYDERIYRPEIMEYLLHDLGICALIETETTKYTPVICYLAGGDRYNDGLFKTAICYDAIGKEYIFEDWQNNPDICVIFNNGFISPDSWIHKNESLLTDIDTSLHNNIVFSRLKPVPIARDSKTKNQVDNIVNDLLIGKIETLMSEPTFKDLADDKKLIDVLDLTDVQKSQYIQYLIHAYDFIFSRTCMLMGLDIPDNGKQAQITTDELNRHEDVSHIMPLVWYQSRKQAFEKAGLDFDFSDFMKNRLNISENVPRGTSETENVPRETSETEENREEETENVQ